MLGRLGQDSVRRNVPAELVERTVGEIVGEGTEEAIALTSV